MKEYKIISEIFAPLTSNYDGAMGLSDDVAIVAKDETTDYVITTDAIVEGTHFLENSIPEAVAARLMAANLSDIASAGASPKFFLLNGSISSRTDEKWLRNFADKISRLQRSYNIHLIGGDTIKSEEKLFFSATVIGEVEKGKTLLRSNAKEDENIYVSGFIGEAYIGLKILKGEIEDLSEDDKNYFINRYIDPEPRVKMGLELSEIATSCTDISDGLIIDLENICKTSKVSARLEKSSIPISYKKDNLFNDLISAGDDYELIFTAPKGVENKIEEISKNLDINISKVGEIIASKKEEHKVKIFDGENEYCYSKKGYEHEV